MLSLQQAWQPPRRGGSWRLDLRATIELIEITNHAGVAAPRVRLLAPIARPRLRRLQTPATSRLLTIDPAIRLRSTLPCPVAPPPPRIIGTIATRPEAGTGHIGVA